MGVGARIPGPLCSSRVGNGWIDAGTSCRSRSGTPGPLNFVATLILGALPTNPDKVKFDKEHLYSMAPEAARKRAIDLQIISGDYSRGREISMENEAYLKQLIEIASHGKQNVGASGKGNLQFFIIRGGAEGFLPAWLAKQDASNVVMPGETTSGKSTITFRFDDNDMLAVFDSGGTLVSSARLERPLFITGVWSQRTADKVYNSWNMKEVFIYKNTSFDIPYLGLGVKDGMRGKTATVDLHKQEATNGCIFIVDPNTPALDNSNLGKFEPKLIIDILKKTGRKVDDVKSRVSLGVMRVVTIK